MTFDRMRLAKGTLFIAVAVSSLVLPAVSQAQAIDLIETDSGSGDVLTTNNPLAIITQNAADDWSIDLSALGITASGNDLPQQWVEAPGDSGVNAVEIQSASIIRLLSEDSTPPGTPDDFCGTGSPLALGVSCALGLDASGTQWYVTVREDVAASPEPASLFLSGLGLAGLAIAGIRRKRQA